MPRNVKESDDEVEPKSGRRTRAALNPSVLDSPLRRSSRIKQPAQQDGSSPESLSDTSSVGPVKGTRRRTTTGDSGTTEPTKTSRTRRTSMASDISELAETESPIDGPAKRVTRRSVAGVPSAETPTKLNSRTRRTTRAGSESKTSPPAARTTRRTRASSLEPEGTDDQRAREMSTPVKSRRRASVLPSEPAVAEEESEDSGKRDRRSIKSTVYEVEEESELASQNALNSSRRRSKIDQDKSVEAMEIDDDSVDESEGNTGDACTQEVTETGSESVSKTPDKLDESTKVGSKVTEANKPEDVASPSITSKNSSITTETMSISFTENQEKSPGNKENENLNDSIILLAGTVKLSTLDVRSSTRKSFSSIYAKSSEKRHNISLDERFLSTNYTTPTKSQENVINVSSTNTTENMKRKERYSVDDCVVVIEPMEIDRTDKIDDNSTEKSDNGLETRETENPEEDVNVKINLNEKQDTNHELSKKDENVIIQSNEEQDTNNELSKKDENVIIQSNEEQDTNNELSKKDENVKIQSNENQDTNVELLKEDENNSEIIVIDDDVAIDNTDSTMTNVMTEITIEEQPKNHEEPEIMEIVESTEQSNPREIDTIDANVNEKSVPPITMAHRRPSITNEKQTPRDDKAIVEESSTEPSTPKIVTVDTLITINPENPSNSDSTMDNDVCVKDGKSSIVTESPSGGPNNVELSNSRDEHQGRKSITKKRSSNANERTNEIPEIVDTEKTPNKSVEKVVTRASDDESEFDDYPSAFKDIPADEWTIDKDADCSKKNHDVEENSVQSLSTERNESECDFELIDKDVAARDSDKDDPMGLDYESDDTVKIAIATNGSQDAKDLDESREDGEIRDESSGNVEDDENVEDVENNEKDRSVRRVSLNNSSKINETGATPKKNVSLIVDTSVKDSPSESNASRSLNSSRKMKSATNTPNGGKTANESLSKLNRSGKKLEIDDDDEDVELSGSIVSRDLNSSKKMRSVTNTPSNVAKKANESLSALNRSAEARKRDDDEDLEKSAMETSMKKQSKGRSSVGNGRDSLSSRNNSPGISKIDDDRLNRSAKNRSFGKSLSDENSSMIVVDEDHDSDNDVEESKKDLSTRESQLNKSRKSTSAKKSKTRRSEVELTQSLNSDNEITEDTSTSPNAEDEILEKSVKIGSAKKSVKSGSPKKSPTKRLVTSESEAEDLSDDSAMPETVEEAFEKSVKIGSAKKSSLKNDSKMKLAITDSETETNENDATDRQANEDEKSVEKTSAKKRNSNARQNEKSLTSSSDDDDDSQWNSNRSSKSGSARKSLINKNYSTIAQVNSDSEIDEEVESDESDDADVSRKIPRFLFDADRSSDDSDNDGSSKSMDSDIARELNLDGKSVLEYSDDNVPADDCMATESESSDEDDDGADLADFVVDDDDDEDEAENSDEADMDVDIDEDENNVSSTIDKKSPRKRIIPRPSRASDSDDSDASEKPVDSSQILDKSTNDQTPLKIKNSNKMQNIVKSDTKSVDLNLSARSITATNKNLLIQSSTPKTMPRHSLSSEKSNSSKTQTPTSKSLKSADSSAKLEASSLKLDSSSNKKLSKSICETMETSMNPESSLKNSKTPKMSASVKKQLQTSLPTDLNDSRAQTNLSKVKSTKISTLNQTVMAMGSESPETRFLMKEKLNDSMPVLKLQQKTAARRKSALDNLREKMNAMNESPAEIDEINEKSMEKRVSIGKVDVASESEAIDEKPKKNKKKKKKNTKNSDNSNASENPEESVTSIVERMEEGLEDSSVASAKIAKKVTKKSKKNAMKSEPEENTRIPEISEAQKKKKKKTKQEMTVEVVEPEETENNDKNKKKKKKKMVIMEESVESNEMDESDKKKKKKKKKQMEDRESLKLAEPEVTTLRQKSRRIAARNNGDSEDAPEAVDFARARDAALRDLRKVAETMRAGKEARTKKTNDNDERKMKKIRAETSSELETKLKRSVKRLPDDVLEALTDVTERPTKRRKIVRDENFVPSTSMFGQQATRPKNLNVDDGFIPLSSVGGTTQFSVVNLKKAAKHSKKSVAASTFRERMLARNPRQPVSAYLVYQQKQKASGQGRPY